MVYTVEEEGRGLMKPRTDGAAPPYRGGDEGSGVKVRHERVSPQQHEKRLTNSKRTTRGDGRASAGEARHTAQNIGEGFRE